MAFDAHKNFAYSTVATAPSPATSGTSLVVQSGDGAKFPAAPFNAIIFPAGAQPLSSNAEIVRVTNISTNTLTIVRTQESTSARSVIIGDQIDAGITAKSLTDVESGGLMLPSNITELGTWNVNLLPFFPNATIAGTWAITYSANLALATQYLSDGTQNDEIHYQLFLQAGTYTLNLVGDKDVNRGIYTVLLNGSSVGTLDAYAGTRANIATMTLTSIVVATTGVQTFGIKMATKNASSGGYYATPSLFNFIRTA